MRSLKSENDLEAESRKLATLNGYKLLKWVCPSLRGVPDRILFKHKEIIFIEFKNPNGKGEVSPQQAKRHKELRELGHRVEVIDNLEDFKELL